MRKVTTRPRRLTITCTLVLAAVSASALTGCGIQQSIVAPVATEQAYSPAHPLLFKGRLGQGDRDGLPPAVAMSLSDTSPLTFSYREELTHDEYHIPLLLSAIDPVTYIGSPLGDYGVTASATLSIMDGNKVLGDYTAKAHVSKSYNLYSEPTHLELERAAQAAVRLRIDQKIYDDEDRVARAIASTNRVLSDSSSK